MTPPDQERSRPGSPTRSRRLAAALACALVALFSTVGPASTAQAHNELTSSTPSAGALLTNAPQQVRLVFIERVEPRFTTVTLTVADKPAMILDARVDGPTVTVNVPSSSSATSVRATGGPLVWRVDYRVVSADGHPVSGSVSFSVASAGRPPASNPSPSSPVLSNGEPTPAPVVSTHPPVNASASKDGTPVGNDQPRIPLVLLLGFGVVVAVGAAVWLTRTNSKPGSS